MAKVNATGMMLFGVTYFIIFGVFMGILPFGNPLTFSLWELLNIVVVSAVAAIIAATLAAALASFKIFGWGSTEAGPVVWKAALFGIVVIWATYFSTKMMNMMPVGTPIEIELLFVAPPLAAFLYGMFAAYLKVG